MAQKYYRDVREHLKALEERGKLVRIKREINKDTELMPLVRWQFRGLEEADRKAFFFENVVDVKGKRYTMPVSVGTLAASTEIYSIGLMCRPEEIAASDGSSRPRSILSTAAARLRRRRLHRARRHRSG